MDLIEHLLEWFDMDLHGVHYWIEIGVTELHEVVTRIRGTGLGTISMMIQTRISYPTSQSHGLYCRRRTMQLHIGHA